MRKAFFTCGPFAEILDRVEDFGSGLYFSQLYYDTIMEHQELEVQLSQAKEEDDDDKDDDECGRFFLSIPRC